MSKPLIIITVEGGVIQDISADVPIEATVIDFDIDGADDTIDVPQSGGGTESARCTEWVTGPDKVKRLAANLRKQLKQYEAKQIPERRATKP